MSYTLLKIAAPAVVGALAATLTVGPAPAATAARTTTVTTTRTTTSIPAVSAGPFDVRVAGFNIQSVGVDRTRGEQRPWRQRRGTVISEILGERVDVIGVQEANPSNYFAARVGASKNQMLDLRNGLNAAGGHYALNTTAAVNCVNPLTTYHCRYRYRAASASERILYDTTTLTMVGHGFTRYQAQSGPRGTGGLVWAVLRSKRNGHEFLFTSTHLCPTNRAVRVAQWKQAITSTRRIKGTLPVVSVGDYNTHRMDSVAQTMLPAMRNAGFGDVLNQQYLVNPGRGTRAESLTNAWVNSYNHESRAVSQYSYEDSRRMTGVSIDYVFASNYLRIKAFKLVLRFDPRTLRVAGTLPSDHNLLRATVVLP